MIPGAPFKRLIVADFETAWCSKSGYTLSKMTTEEYLRDPRFHAWGMCWKDFGNPAPATWVSHDDLPGFFASIDWDTTAVACQNTMFDAAILSWRYGVSPCFVFDTLSMGRALRGVEVGNSLKKLAEFYGLPPKGNAVHDTDGILPPNTLSPQIEKELAEYCAHDVFLCEEILKRMLADYPVKELRLIDMTLKMFLNPVLELDQDMLREAIEDEKTKREGLLVRLGVPEKDLASNPKFARILEGMGLEAPTKLKKPTAKTPNPVGRTFAFAKSDALFQAMLNGPREDVALLCEARLVAKSTQARTRAQRFLDIGTRGPLPIPLNYYAAATGRWGGTQAINLQNMKRGSFLRNAIMAPAGHSIVVGDLRQIEPRVVAWLTGDEAMLTAFRSGVDAYSVFGARMFNKPGMTQESEPLLRQSAKSALIGANYYLGWASFAAQLLTGFLGAPPVRYDKAFAKQLGVTPSDVERFVGWDVNIKKMALIPHTCTEEELLVHCLAAKAIIDKYRAAAQQVVAFWAWLQSVIQRSLYDGEEINYKCLVFRKGEILLPNGMRLVYPNLTRKVEPSGQVSWTFGNGENIYSGKILENLAQALARIVMTDGMLRVQRRYPVVFTCHDEQALIVPDAEAEEAVPWVRSQMVKVPPWMEGIPLDAEVSAGKRYGQVK